MRGLRGRGLADHSTAIRLHPSDFFQSPAAAKKEIESHGVFGRPDSGGILHDFAGEDASCDNKNDLLIRAAFTSFLRRSSPMVPSQSVMSGSIAAPASPGLHHSIDPARSPHHQRQRRVELDRVDGRFIPSAVETAVRGRRFLASATGDVRRSSGCYHSRRRRGSSFRRPGRRDSRSKSPQRLCRQRPVCN